MGHGHGGWGLGVSGASRHLGLCSSIYLRHLQASSLHLAGPPVRREREAAGPPENRPAWAREHPAGQRSSASPFPWTSASDGGRQTRRGRREEGACWPAPRGDGSREQRGLSTARLPPSSVPFQPPLSIFSPAFLNAAQRDPRSPGLALPHGAPGLGPARLRGRLPRGEAAWGGARGCGRSGRLVSRHWPRAQAVPCRCQEPACLGSASPPGKPALPASTSGVLRAGPARRASAGVGRPPTGGPWGQAGGEPARGAEGACRRHQRRSWGSDALTAPGVLGLAEAVSPLHTPSPCPARHLSPPQHR